MSIDDSDIYHCYVDLWKGPSERFVMAYQGIGKDNVFKHRIGAADAASNDEDQAIATAFGKRLCIPLDFELLCGRALVRAHILTDFNYATLTSPYIFQKTVECKLILLR